MANTQLPQRTANLRQMPLVHLAASLRREEVVRATIRVERTEQPLRRDGLAQTEEARHRAFLVHQESPSRSSSSHHPSSRPGRDRAPACLSSDASNRPETTASPASDADWRFRRCLPRASPASPDPPIAAPDASPCRLPLTHREHRHHHARRPDDDADGWRVRRIRASDDP